MIQFRRISLCRLATIAVLMGGSAIAATAPATAQDAPYYDEDIVVEGHYGQSLRDAESLSQAVSYADLDLRFARDREILRHRISMTARYLCQKLGEDEPTVTFGRSCREEAERDAYRRLGTVEANYVPHDSVVLAPRWVAPYPASWDR